MAEQITVWYEWHIGVDIQMISVELMVHVVADHENTDGALNRVCDIVSYSLVQSMKMMEYMI